MMITYEHDKLFKSTLELTEDWKSNIGIKYPRFRLVYHARNKELIYGVFINEDVMPYEAVTFIAYDRNDFNVQEEDIVENVSDSEIENHVRQYKRIVSSK